MSPWLEKFVGPRVPANQMELDRKQFQIPTLCLTAAAILLLISIFLPYWKMELLAPQYPKGLSVMTYVNRVEGDVA